MLLKNSAPARSGPGAAGQITGRARLSSSASRPFQVNIVRNAFNEWGSVARKPAQTVFPQYDGRKDEESAEFLHLLLESEVGGRKSEVGVRSQKSEVGGRVREVVTGAPLGAEHQPQRLAGSDASCIGHALRLVEDDTASSG